MSVSLDNRVIWAVGTMVGSIVGVGIFGLPYAFVRGGVAAGAIVLLVLAGVITAMQLMYAEVALHTSGRHRLPGYAREYLGARWSRFAAGALALGLWGSMVAYLIVGGTFLHALASPIFGGGTVWYALVLWSVVTVALARGVQFVSRVGTVAVALLLFLFAFIVLAALPHAHAANLTGLGRDSLLVPYGVVLFALAGVGVVPELKAVLGRARETQLPRVIVTAMAVITGLYLLFGVSVASVLGPRVTEIAFDGLVPVLGDGFQLIASVLGTATILSVFSLVAIELVDTFRYDLHRSSRASVALAVVPPLLLYLAGVRGLIDVLLVVGSVLGGTLGILIVAMYERMRADLRPAAHRCLNVPRAVSLLVVLIFLSGMILTITNLLG